MTVVELRSDTFTLPTSRMRRVMAAAEVGNDGYREDPTVRRLEEVAAATLGKPAGCLMPTGTMANLAAVLVHVPRGSKLLVGDESDIFRHEAGGAAVCGGAVYEPVRTLSDGRLPLAAIEAGFPADPSDPDFAPAALICLESTHNRCGGRALSGEYLAEVGSLARARGVPLHLDGARLFNAAVALGVPAARLAGPADSVQFCLSKGLGAPIGSVLVGEVGFVAQARRVRKLLGGGMRQAGVIAAAGLVAMAEAPDRLPVDHQHARRLADGLRRVAGVRVDPVETNIVLFSVTAPGWSVPALLVALRARGVAMGELVAGKVRAVTHRDVDAAGVDRAVSAVAEVLRADPPPTAQDHRERVAGGDRR